MPAADANARTPARDARPHTQDTMSIKSEWTAELDARTKGRGGSRVDILRLCHPCFYTRCPPLPCVPFPPPAAAAALDIASPVTVCVLSAGLCVRGPPQADAHAVESGLTVAVVGYRTEDDTTVRARGRFIVSPVVCAVWRGRHPAARAGHRPPGLRFR